jgi:hypothetical protein
VSSLRTFASSKTFFDIRYDVWEVGDGIDEVVR